MESSRTPLRREAKQRRHSHQLAQEGNTARSTALSVTLRAQDNPLPLFIRGLILCLLWETKKWIRTIELIPRVRSSKEKKEITFLVALGRGFLSHEPSRKVACGKQEEEKRGKEKGTNQKATWRDRCGTNTPATHHTSTGTGTRAPESRGGSVMASGAWESLPFFLFSFM